MLLITITALALLCLISMPRRKPDHSARMAERACEYAKRYHEERGNWS